MNRRGFLGAIAAVALPVPGIAQPIAPPALRRVIPATCERTEWVWHQEPTVFVDVGRGMGIQRWLHD